MSWLRSAVNNAMSNHPEAGGKSKFSRTVRQVANTVAKQAGLGVSGERSQQHQHQQAGRYLKSFRHTVKGLDELSVSCRGVERVFLLRRWLVGLKEVERVTKGASEDSDNYNFDYSNSNINFDDENHNSDEELLFDEPIDPPRKPVLVYYYDPDMGGEPMTFRDVFLSSKALEGLISSMILDAPNEEELSILTEIFRLCLNGGKETHRLLLCKIQDLAKTFSSYQDEVLIKREEILQYAQSAIAGLKINADIERIDSEASSLKEALDNMKTSELPSNETPAKSFDGTTISEIEALKEARMQIRLLSELKDLLMKKKSLSNGDSPQLHAEKVDKLKILSESLGNSTSKAQTRITDQRSQKDDAVKLRVAKAEEVILIEKDLVVEITELEKQRNELEDRLKEVNVLLASACARLNNAREEREQYENASSEILIHLKIKEDELVKSIDSCRAEADVVNAWINFLEDTWVLQSSYMEQKEKQVNGDMERYGEYFVNLVTHLLSRYKEELGHAIPRIRDVVEILRSSPGEEVEQRDESSEIINSRIVLEEEYLELEVKFKTTFSVVDSMKKQFYSQNDGMFRKDDQRVEQLFLAIQRIEDEFESIERPDLESETPTPVAHTSSGSTPTSAKKSPSLASGRLTDMPELEQVDVTNAESKLGIKNSPTKESGRKSHSSPSSGQYTMIPKAEQEDVTSLTEDAGHVVHHGPSQVSEKSLGTTEKASEDSSRNQIADTEVHKPMQEVATRSSSNTEVPKSDNEAFNTESKTAEVSENSLTEEDQDQLHQGRKLQLSAN